MTNDKTLKAKAIQFKGKEYVQVKDRIAYFNEVYPKGSIETVLLSVPDAQTVVFKAIVKPEYGEFSRVFVGHSQAKWGEGFVNTTAALENAETSAVGRALAMMGIGVIDSVASIDEVRKATSYNSTGNLKCSCNAPAGKPHGTQCPLNRGIAGENFPND